MTGELDALRKVPTEFALTPDEMWDDDARPHVVGINDVAFEAIRERIDAAKNSSQASVRGLPVVGQGGTGKTHLLGLGRQTVQDAGGHFVRLNIVRVDDFWSNLASSYLHALNVRHRRGGSGLEVLLNALADKAGLDAATRETLLVRRLPDRQSVYRFSDAVRSLDEATLAGTRHTLQGLLLLFAADGNLADIGDIYLNGGEFDPEGRFGPHRPVPKSALERARELSHLMALTGPTLIAVDQIDDIVRASRRATGTAGGSHTGELLDMLGIGLTDLRDQTRRTTVVLSCLPHIWEEFRDNTTSTVLQRFTEPVMLDNRLPDVETAARLLASMVEPAYKEAGFDPRYPSYPFPPSGLAGADRYTPRRLLNAASAHIRACLAAGIVTEATALDSAPRPAATPPAATDDLSARFERYRSTAEISTAVDAETEDSRMPQLMCAVLRAWILEQDGRHYEVRPPAGARPSAHAEILLKSSEGPGERWTFRAVASTNARAVGNRVSKLFDYAGIGRDNPVEHCHGILWVTAPAQEWGRWGPNTQARRIVSSFEAEGLVIPADSEDLKSIVALHRLEAEHHPGWEEWLRKHRPAGRTRLLSAVFGPPNPSSAAEPPEPPPDPEPDAPTRPVTSIDIPLPRPENRPGPVPPGSGVAFGSRAGGGVLTIELATLAKHTAIFAGSGSGKTVLIKRIVEACALEGVSSIVLDPNNDLSRLGRAWPEPPDNWLDGDDGAAERYLSDTEVVVWTPGRTSGRPLSFQPLPDLCAVADDPDDFEIALDTVVSALAPRARINRSTAKDERQRAVLREALRSFTYSGGGHFDTFLDHLSQLPPESSLFEDAPKTAADIAATLRAVRVNDRLFAGDGEGLDPGVLLTPKPGRRARVSVVNFMGLPSEEQRQGFVNQLQMALFSWLKSNPAAGRPLGGLLVLDEAQTFAPAVGSTPCTDSTLALVSQARKYGLGMVFATQAPKGVHNRIVGNSATHAYGRLNAPAQIAAAAAIAEDKGGTPVDLAHLSTGQFYVVTPGLSTQQVDVPMCLSHHPSTAPTSEEILAAVRAETDTGG
ncbi:DUF87 domain-containing protein [Glycomyces sp. L485]|uniref:helicase HerA domain-containing protein n=1 Tax=Glycomyces sp. L485 TaxID=2909235 RepID=UPI001F4B2582|nr:DUF87 domain-containing protein [Glycomyces sp. L485]MCH7230891.1 DUF87 domain-containing protein [Glycomyces sp. L485]